MKIENIKSFFLIILNIAFFIISFVIYILAVLSLYITFSVIEKFYEIKNKLLKRSNNDGNSQS